MNKVFAGVAVFLAVLVSCRHAPGTDFTAIDRVGWDDYAAFAPGLKEKALFSSYPFLRQAPVYHLELELGDNLSTLTGRAKIRFTNTEAEARSRLDFVLLPNIASGSMQIARTRVDGLDAVAEVSPDGMVLRLTFPHPLASGESAVIAIDYALSIPRNSTVGFGGLESSGGTVSLGYAYPMIPATGRWGYGKPPAYGDLTANPVSFYLAEISYPAGLVLAAPGRLLHHAEQGGRVRDLLSLGPARDFYFELGNGLELTQKQVGDVELRALTSGSAVKSAATVLDVAAHALPIFEGLFGPYPYRSLTFVSTKFDAYGLEFPAVIVLTSWLYGDPARVVGGASVRTLLEATVAHEVAHQWFYALLGNDQLSEPWIDESFAQYATLRYYTARYGEAGAAGFRRSLDGRVSRVNGAQIPLGRAVSSYTPKEYGAVIYGRGPLFLEALSKRMGSERFDAFLKGLTRTYRWKTITGKDIKAAAEQSCSCSLGELWAEWIGP